MNAPSVPSVYEQDTKSHTVYVSGLPDNVTEQAVLSVFVAFGDIVEIQMPKEARDVPKGGHGQNGPPAKKLRGFAFITFSSSLDAQDAIDNYDLNFFPGHPGRVLKCNLARPQKGKADGSRANNNRAVWSSEDWLSKHGTDAPSNPEQADGEAVPAPVEAQEEEDEVEQ